MKRKLVTHEVFAEMRDNSLTTTVKELVEAEEHLARTLDIDGLTLSSFTEATVIYEKADGNYLRANYSLNENTINFDDVEELVINEESERQESKKIIRNMLEAILEDKEADADEFFSKYMELASRRYKREHADHGENVIEERFVRQYGSPERTGGSSTPKTSIRVGSKNMKKSLAAKQAHRSHRASYISGARKRKRNRSSEKSRRPRLKRQHSKLRALSGGQLYTGTRKRKKMNEWLNLSNNVYGYIDFTENSHVDCKVITENDSTSVIVPTSKTRNEGKVLKMHFANMLKTDVKILREQARRLANDNQFCQMVAAAKRFNNLSSNDQLEESISGLVKNYPGVLYLTQTELAKTVSTALDRVGVKNYDDDTCNFIAEGILRVAHDSYTDRVNRIRKLANQVESKESQDKYLDFQQAVSEFFPSLDESTNLELKMFEDLYNAALDIRNIAIESENDVIRAEAQDFASELAEVLNGEAPAKLELAADVADWLEELAEANLPGASDTWDVVKKPHQTETGDHPQMAKNAKVDGNPGKYPGDWGDEAPMIGQDSNAWNHGDEARNRSWGNKGGKDVWPSLDNPYTLKPFGDYKMKGEKNVVDDPDGFGTWQDNETWPNLTNPYVPQSSIPKQKVQPDNSVE